MQTAVFSPCVRLNNYQLTIDGGPELQMALDRSNWMTDDAKAGMDTTESQGHVDTTNMQANINNLVQLQSLPQPDELCFVDIHLQALRQHHQQFMSSMHCIR